MIEKLLTSKNRVKILAFLLFESEETHIREISNKLKIAPSAVKREIDNLNSTSLIKISRNKIVLNKECNYLEDLKNIFIKTDYIFYPLKESLDGKKIEYTFIFGSFARGSPSVDSDIDLMVIGDIRLSEVIALLEKAEKKVKRSINPVVWTLENLKKEKNSSFIKDVFKKGIIMLKGNENELKKIIG